MIAITPDLLLGESLILDLQELLKILVAQMRAKGHEGAEAVLEIGNEGSAMLRLRVRNGAEPFVSTWGAAYSSEFFEARNLQDVLTQAREVIARMEVANV